MIVGGDETEPGDARKACGTLALPEAPAKAREARLPGAGDFIEIEESDEFDEEHDEEEADEDDEDDFVVEFEPDPELERLIRLYRNH